MTCITTPSYTTHHSTQSINTLCTTQQYIIHCTSTTQCHYTLRITVHYALTMSLKKMNFDLNLTAPSPEVDHKFINPKCESVHACIFSSFFLLVCPLPPSPPPHQPSIMIHVLKVIMVIPQIQDQPHGHER